MKTWAQNVLTLLFVAWVGVGSTVRPVQASVARSDTIRVDTLSRAGVDDAAAQIWSILEKYPDTEFAPTLMFQLVQLYMRGAQLDFEAAMERYDEQLQRFENGQISEEPELPKADFSRAITVARELLRRYPDVSFKAKVLYTLGLCYEKEGNKTAYLEACQQLVRECPDDPLVPEVYFRIGEFYFDEHRYEDAVKAYSKLLDKWESPYFDMALYKLAWSYYNLSDYPNAISTFVYLVDDLNTVERANPQLMGRNPVDLRKEAIQYIAISFSEFGGVAKAEDFFQGLGGRKWEPEVFLRLGKVYLARSDYASAVKTLRRFLARFPNHSQAIDAALEIVKAQEAARDLVNADRSREEIVEMFGPHSEWYKQAPSEGKARADSVVQSTLLVLAQHYTQAARDTKDASYYQQAVGKYRQYLELFPDAPHADQAQFNLGEVLVEAGQLRQAAEEYRLCFEKYVTSPYAEKAGYNRVFCWAELADRAAGGDTTDVQLFSFLGQDSVRTVSVPDTEHAELLHACHEFVNRYPDSDKWSVVMLKMGQTLFDVGDYEQATRVYQAILEHDVPANDKARALAMIGQCKFRLGDYLAADEWFAKLGTAYADSDKYASLAARMRASSRYKLAVALKDSGRAEDAARVFASAAELTPDQQLAQVSLFEAATQFEKAGLTEKAIETYLKLANRYKTSKFADECLHRAGMLLESSGEWSRAATIYLQLVQRYPESRFAERAFFLAGGCYENLGDLQQARRIYEDFTRRFGKKDPDDYLEALVKAGEIAFDLGDVGGARAKFTQALQDYNNFRVQLVPVDDFLAAKAQFYLAEIAFRDYQAVKLRPPFDKALRRKKDGLNRVLKAYTEAARYKVAEWSTASFHRIGEAFEEFANTLLTAPIPAGLTDVQKAAYLQKLEEKVRPFKEKAYQAYKRNVAAAENAGIDNEWIAKSRERMEALAVQLHLDLATSPTPADSAYAEKAVPNTDTGVQKQ